MSHEFEIDVANNTLVERWAGDVELADLMRGFDEVVQHPDFRWDLDAITDFSDAHLDFSQNDLLAFSGYVRSRGWVRAGRKVMVAPKDIEFGIGRQAQGFWDLGGSMVVRSLEEARAWLARPQDG